MRPLGRQIYYLIGVSVVVMLIAGTMLVVPVLADEGPISEPDSSPSRQTHKKDAKAAYQDFITKLAANLEISDSAKVDNASRAH